MSLNHREAVDDLILLIGRNAESTFCCGSEKGAFGEKTAFASHDVDEEMKSRCHHFLFYDS